MAANPQLSPSASRLPKLAIDLEAIESGTSLWQDAWHRLRKNKLALVSFWFLVTGRGKRTEPHFRLQRWWLQPRPGRR